MEPRRLRLLLELSRRGSMRAVADELGYTTSTVSQQLGVLAREAATPLIEPAGRMVRLTPAGQRLADHAVTILAALEAARADLDPAAEPAGIVRVAGFATAIRRSLVPVLAALTETHPAVELQVREHEPPEAMALLADDDVAPALVYDYNLPPRPRRPPPVPLPSLDPLPHNLPIQLTSFVGRERELADVRAALAGTRLLTLTGAGGCGKTRLAAQAAAEALDDFAGGVWWVELAPLPDGGLVERAIADAVGVRPLPGQTALEAVAAHIADASALVVLDHCEHVTAAAAACAEALLRGCPSVSVLATSRAALGVGAETQ